MIEYPKAMVVAIGLIGSIQFSSLVKFGITLTWVLNGRFWNI